MDKGHYFPLIISVFSGHYGKLFRKNETEIGQEIDEYFEGTRLNKLTETKARSQDFAQEANNFFQAGLFPCNVQTLSLEFGQPGLGGAVGKF